MHVDAVAASDRVLLVDDLLATGGTAAAARSLVQKAGAKVVGIGFVVELAFLNGLAKFPDAEVCSLIRY